jgi:hypothetical protein
VRMVLLEILLVVESDAAVRSEAAWLPLRADARAFSLHKGALGVRIVKEWKTDTAHYKHGSGVHYDGNGLEEPIDTLSEYAHSPTTK